MKSEKYYNVEKQKWLQKNQWKKKLWEINLHIFAKICDLLSKNWLHSIRQTYNKKILDTIEKKENIYLHKEVLLYQLIQDLRTNQFDTLFKGLKEILVYEDNLVKTIKKESNKKNNYTNIMLKLTINFYKLVLLGFYNHKENQFLFEKLEKYWYITALNTSKISLYYLVIKYSNWKDNKTILKTLQKIKNEEETQSIRVGIIAKAQIYKIFLDKSKKYLNNESITHTIREKLLRNTRIEDWKVISWDKRILRNATLWYWQQILLSLLEHNCYKKKTYKDEPLSPLSCDEEVNNIINFLLDENNQTDFSLEWIISRIAMYFRNNLEKWNTEVNMDFYHLCLLYPDIWKACELYEEIWQRSWERNDIYYRKKIVALYADELIKNVRHLLLLNKKEQRELLLPKIEKVKEFIPIYNKRYSREKTTTSLKKVKKEIYQQHNKPSTKEKNLGIKKTTDIKEQLLSLFGKQDHQEAQYSAQINNAINFIIHRYDVWVQEQNNLLIKLHTLYTNDLYPDIQESIATLPNTYDTYETYIIWLEKIVQKLQIYKELYLSKCLEALKIKNLRIYVQNENSSQHSITTDDKQTYDKDSLYIQQWKFYQILQIFLSKQYQKDKIFNKKDFQETNMEALYIQYTEHIVHEGVHIHPEETNAQMNGNTCYNYILDPHIVFPREWDIEYILFEPWCYEEFSLDPQTYNYLKTTIYQLTSLQQQFDTYKNKYDHARHIQSNITPLLQEWTYTPQEEALLEEFAQDNHEAYWIITTIIRNKSTKSMHWFEKFINILDNPTLQALDISSEKKQRLIHAANIQTIRHENSSEETISKLTAYIDTHFTTVDNFFWHRLLQCETMRYNYDDNNYGSSLYTQPQNTHIPKEIQLLYLYEIANNIPWLIETYPTYGTYLPFDPEIIHLITHHYTTQETTQVDTQNTHTTQTKNYNHEKHYLYLKKLLDIAAIQEELVHQKIYESYTRIIKHDKLERTEQLKYLENIKKILHLAWICSTRYLKRHDQDDEIWWDNSQLTQAWKEHMEKQFREELSKLSFSQVYTSPLPRCQIWDLIQYIWAWQKKHNALNNPQTKQYITRQNMHTKIDLPEDFRRELQNMKLYPWYSDWEYNVLYITHYTPWSQILYEISEQEKRDRKAWEIVCIHIESATTYRIPHQYTLYRYEIFAILSIQYSGKISLKKWRLILENYLDNKNENNRKSDIKEIHKRLLNKPDERSIYVKDFLNNNYSQDITSTYQ